MGENQTNWLLEICNYPWSNKLGNFKRTFLFFDYKYFSTINTCHKKFNRIANFISCYRAFLGNDDVVRWGKTI